jgi:hypothetical protein
MIVHATLAGAAEAGLPHAVGRDRDLASPFEIGDIPISRSLAHGSLNLRLGTAKEALAVGQALAPWVEAPINDVHRNA